ncbi:MAG: hypothetical protein JW784_02550, partial [Candidatus Cloacimonetes bacterium]|nr:hypothetical protein [Candidatus Cloacimonadota bacterium]
LVKLAQLTGLPVVFVAADIQREKVFNSWDRFRLPLPFARVSVTLSEPIIIPPDAEVDQEVEKLQIIFNKLTEQNKIK